MPFFSQHPARVLSYYFVQRTKVYKLKDAEIDTLKRFVKKSYSIISFQLIVRTKHFKTFFKFPK